MKAADLEQLLARADVAALADQLYGHVIECIDFGKLFGLEQLLWCLVDELDIADDLGDLAKALIRRAIVRASEDPATSFSDVPYGISKDEAKAAKFDASCPFCRYEDEHPPEPEEAHEDDCACCSALANDWRKQHAEALRRRGLAVPS